MDGQEPRLLLRMPEVARALGISRSKVYELAQRGELPGVVKLGKSIRVSPDALREWIDRQTGRTAA